jgi:Mg2+-importing ATPase
VLLMSTIGLIAVAFAMPVLADRDLFGFVPLLGVLLAAIAGITVAYVAATELTKRRLPQMGA